MNTNSQRPNREDRALSSLNAAIEAMTTAKDAMGMITARGAFASVSVILTMTRVSFLPIHVGLSLNHVCRTA